MTFPNGSPMSSFRLLLPRALHDAMIAHALAERPNECCGSCWRGRATATGPDGGDPLSAGNERSSPTRGINPRPAAPRGDARHGPPRADEVGVYHSHPTSPAIPAIDPAEHPRRRGGASIISLQGDVLMLHVWRLFETRSTK